MNITEYEITKAAKELGVSTGKVFLYVRKWGRLDLNQLSIAIKGVEYKPTVYKQRNVCGRCHLEKHLCFCSEFEKRLIAKRRKSAGN